MHEKESELKPEDSSQRILALDYGRRRIGVAVTDEIGITAQSRPTLFVKTISDAVTQIGSLIHAYKPACVVIGLPYNLSGAKGEMAQETERFGESVRNHYKVTIEYIDERLTSKQAERTMHALNEKPSRNKARIDSLAAVYLLESYLTMRESRR